MIRYTTRRIVAKTASYTIVKDQPDITGTLFTNRGAVGAVTFTLPTPTSPLNGIWYEFKVIADQSLIVTCTGAIVTNGNAAADNVSFETASQKIGGTIIAFCDGTSWIVGAGRPGGGVSVNGTAVSPNTGATIAEIAVLAGVVAGTVTASKAVVVDANKDVDAAAFRSRILGVGNNYKLARGVHQQLAQSDTIISGLTTVVAVVVSFRDAPTAKQQYALATIGDQAGTPAAGSFLLKTLKSTLAVSDDFTDNINFNWIAVGT